MTDKEMAEEWADKNITLAIYMCNPHAEIIAKQAFLAGLKIGKDTNVSTKWHKVADGDLPKKYGRYWVCRNQSYSPDTVTQEIQYGRNGWCTDCANERDGTQVVVYCNVEGMWFVREAKEFWQKFEKKEWDNERVQ